MNDSILSNRSGILKGKTIIKRILHLSIFCMLLIVSTLVHAETFCVGFFLVEPHAMQRPHEKPEGMAVEYFERIADKMGIHEVQFNMFPLKRLLMALEKNSIDMALLFARSPERAAKFIYPTNPFCLTQPSVAVHASNDLTSVQSVEALLPFTFNESAGAYRSPFILDPRLKIEPLHGGDYTTRCYAKLIKGRIDACYQPDHFPLEFEVNKKKYASKIRILTLPEPPIGLYSVFSEQSAKIYLKAYETALHQVKQEMPYESLFQKYVDASLRQ